MSGSDEAGEPALLSALCRGAARDGALYARAPTAGAYLYAVYIVFLVLWEKDGQPVGEIGEKLLLDNGTLSPLLKKMEQAGYVRRERSREDERVVVITLTEAGRALQEKAKDVPAKVAGCIDLPPEKAQALYGLLYELLENQKKTEGAEG